MFSNLAQILATRPRHAENADARLDIRRHDPDQEKKHKDEEEEKKIGFDTYDNAVVSVDALRVFLENFLASLATPGARNLNNANTALPAQNFSSETQLPETPQEKPHSAEASRAANVYQLGAKTAPRPRADVAPVQNNVNPDSENILPNEEVRIIHGLLRDITVLQARGIEYLTIEKEDTFLASLAAAVKKALT